ncbi:hypothetical protein, partial [Klebsiella pneumoniae]|uniref:hypothetical protein n=1 Tax=Klebsiella pneumoniae TaxID=573 RepID=UPI001C9AA917
MLTEEASKQLLKQHSWYAHQVEMGTGKGEKKYLSQLGFQRWNGHRFEDISDAIVDAWQRQDYPALITEFKISRTFRQEEWNL